VLLWRNTAIGDGSWTPDLYVWDPQRRSVRRITRHANVRQGDPSPDGSTIAATQCGSGKCDLVLVDTRTGYVYGVLERSAGKSCLTIAWDDTSKDLAVRRAQHDAMVKLFGEIPAFWRGVVAKHGK